MNTEECIMFLFTEGTLYCKKEGDINKLLNSLEPEAKYVMNRFNVKLSCGKKENFSPEIFGNDNPIDLWISIWSKTLNEMCRALIEKEKKFILDQILE